MKKIDFKKLIAVFSHKSLIKVIVLAIVLIVVFKNFAGHIQNNQVKQAILPIVIDLPLSTYTPTLKISGFSKPMEAGILKANFKAIVKAINIQKGRFVHKNEVILELSNPEIEKRLSGATARYKHKLAECEAAKKLTQQSFNSANNYLASQADLEEARANLQKAETDAQELKVTAPDDGYLEECYVNVGNTVFAQDKLVNLVYNGITMIRAYVSEDIIEKLKVGMTAQTKLANSEYMAKISGLSNVADPQTRNFYVDLTIINAKPMAYGTTATITLLLPECQGFWINSSALTLDDAGALGVKVLKNSEVVFSPIKLTSLTDQGAYVESVLPRLALVAYGGEYLLPGQTPVVVHQKLPSL